MCDRLVALRTPSLIALFVSAVMGAVFALIFQSDALKEAAAGASAIKGAVKALYGTISFSFEDKMLVELTESSGMAGMLNTVWLIICAMVFGGIMKACRMIESVTQSFMSMIRGRTSMVSMTVASGTFFNLVLADQYLAILVTGNMYAPIFKGKGYKPRLLSRTIEDSVTVTSPLIPWSTCGMTQATMLNVPTMVYLPYSFFNILCPVFSIAIAALGIGIKRAVENCAWERA